LTAGNERAARDTVCHIRASGTPEFMGDVHKEDSIWTRLKGKLTRPLADAAGDRRAQAKAEIEAATGKVPDDDTIDAVQQVVRKRQGDTDPSTGTGNAVA
jgi:hypothetical protein